MAKTVKTVKTVAAPISDAARFGFRSEATRAAIVALITTTKGKPAAQELVRRDYRAGYFVARFTLVSGDDVTAEALATANKLIATPAKLQKDDEKRAHAAFRKSWSRLLEEAGVASTDHRAVGNKGKNAGKRNAAKSTKAHATIAGATVSEVTGKPLPTVAAPPAANMASVETYAMQLATTLHHYVAKNAKAFAGKKGAAMRDAMRKFTREVRAAALIQEEETKKAA